MLSEEQLRLDMEMIRWVLHNGKDGELANVLIMGCAIEMLKYVLEEDSGAAVWLGALRSRMDDGGS